MATFVMQALGMDVAAMNTVHFSKLLHLFLLRSCWCGAWFEFGLDFAFNSDFGKGFVVRGEIQVR